MTDTFNQLIPGKQYTIDGTRLLYMGKYYMGDNIYYFRKPDNSIIRFFRKELHTVTIEPFISPAIKTARMVRFDEQGYRKWGELPGYDWEVISINPDGTYNLQFEDGITYAENIPAENLLFLSFEEEAMLETPDEVFPSEEDYYQYAEEARIVPYCFEEMFDDKNTEYVSDNKFETILDEKNTEDDIPDLFQTPDIPEDLDDFGILDPFRFT